MTFSETKLCNLKIDYELRSLLLNKCQTLHGDKHAQNQIIEKNGEDFKKNIK